MPASESGRLFLRTGSCPEEPLPVQPPAHVSPPRPRTLGPTGFAWLLPGQLAGTPWPGLVQPPAYDLGLLQGAGVTRLVSVADRPFRAELAAQHGMTVEHEPMVDMQPPGIEQAISLCRRIDASLARGDVVAVHCRAGLGRTGTTLAAYWLWQHEGRLDGEQCLQQIRRRHPGWVQSQAQIDFLHAFAPAVARMKSSLPTPGSHGNGGDVQADWDAE
jgi:atypical dual specificity phosphatase